MNKVEKNNNRIDKIKSDRLILLNKVKETLNEKRGDVLEYGNKLLKVIDTDTENVNKYETLINTQALIADLTQKIVEAKTKEEVEELRKKMNYCISKIKNEIKKRNIPEYKINKYYDSFAYLRKDIAKYIRYLKRDVNISEAEELNKRYNDLSSEESEKLKKLLRNEVRYNTRNLNYPKYMKNFDESKKVNDDEKPFSFAIKKEDQIIPLEDNKIVNSDDSIKLNEIKNTDIVNENENNENLFEFKPVITKKYDNVNNYLNDMVSHYQSAYGVIEIYDYNGSFGNKILSLVRNIPKYIENNKRVKFMKRDSQIYYSGADFISYIEYLKKTNSINHGLKSVFSKSYLYSNEAKYLRNHNECSKWLVKYCRENNLEIEYPESVLK